MTSEIKYIQKLRRNRKRFIISAHKGGGRGDEPIHAMFPNSIFLRKIKVNVKFQRNCFKFLSAVYME